MEKTISLNPEFQTSSHLYMVPLCKIWSESPKVGVSLDVIFNTKTSPCNIQRYFSSVKIENFMNNFFFIFFVMLLCRCGSNEFPQSMF